VLHGRWCRWCMRRTRTTPARHAAERRSAERGGGQARTGGAGVPCRIAGHAQRASGSTCATPVPQPPTPAVPQLDSVPTQRNGWMPPPAYTHTGTLATFWSLLQPSPSRCYRAGERSRRAVGGCTMMWAQWWGGTVEGRSGSCLVPSHPPPNG